MSKSTKILSVAAVLGTALAAAGLTTITVGNARSVAIPDNVAQRIDVAFAATPAVITDAAIAAAAERAAKGDLPPGLDCAGQTWPRLPGACLRTADGQASRAVRHITHSYQIDETTTVLVRTPALQVVER